MRYLVKTGHQSILAMIWKIKIKEGKWKFSCYGKYKGKIYVFV